MPNTPIVPVGKAARKRVRDYAAERQRRNALARERGFSSLDTQAKARRRGEFPTARAIRTNPQEAARAEQITENRKQAAGISRKAMDDKSAKWAASHSRQDGTVFKRSWPAQQKIDYYNAFVRWWGVPPDERNFDAVYYYMRTYGGFTASLDNNPYSS